MEPNRIDQHSLCKCTRRKFEKRRYRQRGFILRCIITRLREGETANHSAIGLSIWLAEIDDRQPRRFLQRGKSRIRKQRDLATINTYFRIMKYTNANILPDQLADFWIQTGMFYETDRGYGLHGAFAHL